MRIPIFLATFALFASIAIAALSGPDIAAPFALIGARGTGCAQTLSYALRANRLEASVGGERCGRVPIYNGTAGARGAHSPMLMKAANSARSLVAIDSTQRQCNGTAYSSGTVTAILHIGDAYAPVAPGLLLPSGLWAVVADPNQIGLCLYKGMLAAGEKAAEERANGSTGAGKGVDADAGDRKKSVCFAGHMRVTLADGRRLPMRDLNIGDVVRTGPAPTDVAAVFMFTHREANTRATFVRLAFDNGAPLLLTPGHHIVANGASEPMRADHLQVGDQLQAADADTDTTTRIIKSIDHVVSHGLYNPQTTHGNVVVEGIVVSTYTEAIHHAAAHALLAPLRALFACTRISTSMLDVHRRWPAAILTILT